MMIKQRAKHIIIL